MDTISDCSVSDPKYWNKFKASRILYIDDLQQDCICIISIVYTLETLQSQTKPSIYSNVMSWNITYCLLRFGLRIWHTVDIYIRTSQGCTVKIQNPCMKQDNIKVMGTRKHQHNTVNLAFYPFISFSLYVNRLSILEIRERQTSNCSSQDL